MRLIDANKLMECYENTPDCNIDNCSVPIPVVRQNIIDMPMVNPYEWISVEDELPEIETANIKNGSFRYSESIRVLCACKQRSGKVLVKEGYYRLYSDGKVYWRIPGSIDSVTHWTPLPQPPTEKEN
jgi:hypothetical protein